MDSLGMAESIYVDYYIPLIGANNFLQYCIGVPHRMLYGLLLRTEKSSVLVYLISINRHVLRRLFSRPEFFLIMRFTTSELLR